jgi:hypothetical protein
VEENSASHATDDATAPKKSVRRSAEIEDTYRQEGSEEHEHVRLLATPLVVSRPDKYP